MRSACTRFQDEIVDDPVIGFYERGRRLEIVTYSDPGFRLLFLRKHYRYMPRWVP